MAGLPRAGTFQVGPPDGSAEAMASLCIGSAQLAAGDLDQAELSLEEGLGRAHDVGLDVVALNCRVSSRSSRSRAVVCGARSSTERGDRVRAPPRLARPLSPLRRAACTRVVAPPLGRAAVRKASRGGRCPCGSALGRSHGNRRRGRDVVSPARRGRARRSRPRTRVLRGLRSNNDGWQAPVWLAPLPGHGEHVLAARGDLDEARVALEAHANGRPAEDALLRARLLLASGTPSRRSTSST